MQLSVSATFAQVIQNDDVAQEFLVKMNATAIVETLHTLDLISDYAASDIRQSRSRKDGNNFLLKYMKEEADEKRVRKILTIASKESGYGKMNEFATGLLGKLQWGLYILYIF